MQYWKSKKTEYLKRTVIPSFGSWADHDNNLQKTWFVSQWRPFRFVGRIEWEMSCLVMLLVAVLAWKPDVIREELHNGPRSWEIIKTEELPKEFDL